jgi:protein SCO1
MRIGPRMPVLFIVIASALGAGLAGADVPADAKTGILREIGYDQRLGAALPLETTFRDEQGRVVKLGDYFGKRPVILNLVYFECPMLCTLTLNGLVGALDTLSFDVGREFEVITVSFDARETPALAAAKKAAYLKRYRRPGAAAGWHFLTGDVDQIQALTRAVGFRYAWDAKAQQFAHPAGILVATPGGTISHYLYGIEYTPKDVRFAVVEASNNKVGTPLDKVALYCYQYDPTTGKYGAAVMRLLRVAGALTVLALGSFVFVMRRREAKGALLETNG